MSLSREDRSIHGDRRQNDPVLAMIGIGKALWADEDGDAFIRRERAETNWCMPSELPSENRV